MKGLHWSTYTPPDATSARGWLFALCPAYDPSRRYTNPHVPIRDSVPGRWREQSSLGNYLDYGPDHYRSGHEYCGRFNPGIQEAAPDGCQCRQSQPGNIHCICYASNRSRYVETVEQARAWIEAEALRARPDLLVPEGTAARV